MIFLPRGNPVRQKVNPARINLPEAMEKLRGGTFTGYLRFDTAKATGIILFREGQLISSIYVDSDESKRLIAYDAIAKIFEVSISGHAILNIYKLSADLVLSVHALLHGRYLQHGKDLNELDVQKQLDRIKDESLTVCLRVYTLKNTALVFYDQGYPLGFVHEGAMEMVQSADITTSVALLPGAKFDMLEIRSTDEIVLADLMRSADLGPIWQRTRKGFLQDKQQREAVVVKAKEQQLSHDRQHIFGIFKTIAGNHIGKFGVTQVEKAFTPVGIDLSKRDMDNFYAELQRLARLVAGQSKVLPMIEEMKKRFDAE